MRIHLLAILTIVLPLTVILIFTTNQKQKANVFNYYCGDFGIYGKSLTLMKDSTFRFSYSGCSQTHGFVGGKWTMKASILTLSPKQPNENLDFVYELRDDELIPVDGLQENKLILCEKYVHPLEICNSGESIHP